MQCDDDALANRSRIRKGSKAPDRRGLRCRAYALSHCLERCDLPELGKATRIFAKRELIDAGARSRGYCGLTDDLHEAHAKENAASACTDKSEFKPGPAPPTATA